MVAPGAVIASALSSDPGAGSGWYKPGDGQSSYAYASGTSMAAPGVAGAAAVLIQYPVDVKDFRTEDKARLHADILEMTRKHFQVIRHFLVHESWDYFQFVEIGLDRIHHGFWKHHDPSHPLHDPQSPWRDVVLEYYRLLDHELGTVLGLLDEETMVLVLSDHGARALEGGFCVNQWLMEEGFLTLHSPPDGVTPFDEVAVDWGRTRAWSTGGYYARVFLNVRGREPEGTVAPDRYEAVRNELAARLEAIPDPQGRPLGTRVFRPQEIYADVQGVAPDLIVHFGELAWRAIGSVGHPQLHVQENDTGPDDCNHAQLGAFVLAGPGVPEGGEVGGAHLLDMAPTLLTGAGYQLPPSMQGRDILRALDPASGEGSGRDPGASSPGTEDEALIRERLKGLGYIA